MYMIAINEGGETIEQGYSIPIKAIEQYLKDDEDDCGVELFLSDIYTSEDTINIIDYCFLNNLEYGLVHEEVLGILF